MKQLIDVNEQQMALDFKATSVRVENSFISKPKVVNINAYVRSVRPSVQPTPVLERLLQEAQKLRW